MLGPHRMRFCREVAMDSYLNKWFLLFLFVISFFNDYKNIRYVATILQGAFVDAMKAFVD